MSELKLEIGMPVILVDDTGKAMKGLPLFKGQEGMANTLVYVEGQSLVLFMPNNSTRMFYISESRVEIDMDKIEAWREANE